MHYGIRLWLVSGAVCLVASVSLSALDERERGVALASAYSADPVPPVDAATMLAPPSPAAQVLDQKPQPPPRIYSRDQLCNAAALVAAVHKLPVPFFANLIWQESGFRSHVVSTAGAQGIAQFMPEVAAAYGLENPFDPIPSLVASGRLLYDLHQQFGNLGLTAAAYNAGPKRVLDFMAKRRKLPAETRNYVQSITGLSAEQWAKATVNAADHRLPQHAPCVEVAMALQAQAKARPAQMTAAKRLAGTSAPVKAGYTLASASEKPATADARTRKTKPAWAKAKQAAQPAAKDAARKPAGVVARAMRKPASGVKVASKAATAVQAAKPMRVAKDASKAGANKKLKLATAR